MPTKQRIWKSLKFITEHPVKLPASASQLTVVYSQNGANKTARTFAQQNIPSIKHFNPNVKCRVIKTPDETNRSFVLLETVDGKQAFVQIAPKDTFDDVSTRVTEQFIDMEKKGVDSRYVSLFAAQE